MPGILPGMAKPFPLLSALIALLPIVAPAETLICDTPGVQVEAADRTLAQTVCDNAQTALRQIAQCNLTLQSPISIHLVDKIVHPLGQNCLAYANCKTSRIEVTEPAALAQIVAKNKVYSQVPANELLLGLITHELTHLLIDQSNPKGQNTTDHEYMAYVMQMHSYAPETRQIFLDQVDLSNGVDPMRINAFFMMAVPTNFAAYAWAHFSLPENGCAHFQRLLSGQATFHYMIY